MAAEPLGLLARTVAALRYTITGNTAWFGPLNPLPPQAPPEVKGRIWDYPVGMNLSYAPRSKEPINFTALKNLAGNCGPLRIIMERQKDLMVALDWRIKVKGDKGKTAKSEPDASIIAISDFLERPDQDHDWDQWLRAILEQLMVIDAVSIYARPTLAGELYALDVIDGATITPVIDQGGRRPEAPDSAYEQILKGIVAAHFTADELIYYPQNYRADKVYGYSRVEQVKDIVEQQIARMKSQLGYFTHGNLGDGYFTGPPEMVADQIAKVEKAWNDMMTASIAGKREALFLPNGFEFHETKVDVLADEFDEWLIRLVCFPFGVSPTPFLKQTGLGQGSAKTDYEAGKEGGISPLMKYVRRLMNRILSHCFGRPDLEFVWSSDHEVDAKTQSETRDRDLKNGTIVLDEARAQLGLDPYPDGLGSKPIIYDSATPVERILEPPAPPPALIAPPGTLAPGDGTGKKPDEETDPGLKKAASKDEKALAAVFATWFAEHRDDIASQLGNLLGVEKAAMDDYSGRIDAALDQVDWEWSGLAAKVEPFLAGIAAAAGETTLRSLSLFDPVILEAVTARASSWARAKAAEMVGKRYVAGQLIDNPDAVWVIAKTTRKMLRALIASAMKDGASNAQLAKQIRESAAFSKDRADAIARTETASAEIQGQRAGWKESGLVAGKQWLAAPDCCDDCQSYEGTIVSIDDEFPWGPVPAHPNCFPGDTLVLADGILATTERAYDGDVIIIRTTSGKKLTCTPNHPVLTSDGWVGAGALDIGTHVISSRVGDWESPTGETDDAQDMPARIEDISESFRRSRKVTTVEMPVSAPDFHGDGLGSKVAVVRTDRFLMQGVDSARRKGIRKAPFFRRDMELLAHDSLGASLLFVDAVGPPDRSAMRGSDLCGAGGSVHPGPFENLSFPLSATADTLSRQPQSDCTAIDAVHDGKGVFGHAGEVLAGQSGFVDGHAGPDLDARLLHLTADHRLADAGLSADLRNVLSGGVFCDTVVNLTRQRFAGHVYNLSTKSGAYIAQGIVTHNCRCDELPVLPEDMPESEA